MVQQMRRYSHLDLINLILNSGDAEVLEAGLVILNYIELSEYQETLAEEEMDRGSAADQEADYLEDGSVIQTDS